MFKRFTEKAFCGKQGEIRQKIFLGDLIVALHYLKVSHEQEID